MVKTNLLFIFLVFSLVGFSQNKSAVINTDNTIKKNLVKKELAPIITTSKKSISKKKAVQKTTTTIAQTKQFFTTVTIDRPDPTPFNPDPTVDPNQTQAPN